MFDARTALPAVHAASARGPAAGPVGRIDGARASYPTPRVAQMLDHFTQYVGSAPDQSPAVLCGIAHMQTDEGVWYPRGGTGAVPRALEELARELGVEFRCGVGVRRILHDPGGGVRGLETDDGEEIPAGGGGGEFRQSCGLTAS